MKRVERKVIFECFVGSKLYGTSHSNSDVDLMGVYLPSTDDVMSLTPGPDELDLSVKNSDTVKNDSSDTDRKLYSLPKFLRMLSEGQTKQLEMIFAPPSMWITSSPEWEEILSHRTEFLAQNSLTPVLSFAQSQAQNAFMKGENLNHLRSVSKALTDLGPKKFLKDLDLQTLESSGVLKLVTLEENVPGIELAGKKYLLKEKANDVLKKIEKLTSKYGTRSENAARQGLDFRSLHHSYRMLMQAEELTTTGNLTLPMETSKAAFLLSIKRGEYKADFAGEIEAMKNKVETAKSVLKQSVDMTFVNDLCVKLMQSHLGNK